MASLGHNVLIKPGLYSKGLDVSLAQKILIIDSFWLN